MDVVVTGSSGLIGTALGPALEQAGHRMVPMVRGRGGGGALRWDPAEGQIDAAGLEGVGAVVNLAGEGIGAKRWDEEHKARIRDSRVRGTALLAETLAKLQRPPKVLVSGSAVGYYGDRGDEVLTESSRPGDDFLAGVCVAWEAAAAPAREAGIRVSHIRTGIVLSGRGGALAKMLKPFKLGVGGKLGTGRQWMSWISLADEVGAIVHLLGDDAPAGAVNLTAPNPATNADFTKALGQALGRPAVLPVPKVGLRLLLGGEMAEELLLGGQRVLPTRLLDSGYTFTHPDLADALKAALAEAG
ncbi:MAG TPA: TIGR01777 family oxidoreductase [Acidimicrobiia bacterium]|nr:TIGR01777 family oxidoreductase [Acidimicrobiia bacterium]